MQAAVLSKDVLDKYHYDSIEDVREALKKGRRGTYGFGHNSRSSLNMILISEWMEKHLEEKAEAREKMISEIQSPTEPLEIVDYEAYKERVENAPVKSNTIEETEYQKFRAKFFKEQRKR